jgi:hypothetical protein
MEDTSGFYKKVSNEEWWFAPNFVYNKDYTLQRDGNRESIDGWDWSVEPPEEYIKWLEKQRLEELLLDLEDEV